LCTLLSIHRIFIHITIPDDHDQCITEPGRKSAEFSVAVGDPWQGRGIGAKLLKRALEVARDYGIRRVHGEVLAENEKMLSLGRDLGFEIKRGSGSGEYLLTLELGER
jgi:acetyltransferase